MPIPISIHLVTGTGPSRGFTELRERSLADRLRERTVTFGAGPVVGSMFLPLRHIHLFGLLAAAMASVVAVRRFRARTLVVRVTGRCSACDADTSCVLTRGPRSPRWPLTSGCSGCGSGVRLTLA